MLFYENFRRRRRDTTVTLEWDNTSDTTEVKFRRQMSINTLEWHGTRCDVKPSSNRKKVVCLGCSFTWGVGEVQERIEDHIEGGKTYPAHLQEMLGSKYEVLNFGCRGWGLRAIIEWYKYFLRKTPIEICIIQLPHFLRQTYAGFQKPDMLSNYCHGVGAESLRQSMGVKWFFGLEQLAKLDTNRLFDFTDYLNSRGTEPVVLIYRASTPAYSEISEVYWRKVERGCHEKEITCVSGKKLTMGYLNKLGYTITKDFVNVHPNSKGNKFLASKVYRDVFQFKNVVGGF